MGVRSRDNVLRGIDIKAGDPTGDGRGFAFISPTRRRSKTTGELTPYLWVSTPDKLKDIGEDRSGDKLAELIRAVRGSRGAPNGDPGLGGPWEDLAGTLAQGRQTGTFKLAAALRGRGGWHADDALRYMRTTVWPLIDQSQGGHPFTEAEFDTTIREVYPATTTAPASRAARTRHNHTPTSATPDASSPSTGTGSATHPRGTSGTRGTDAGGRSTSPARRNAARSPSPGGMLTEAEQVVDEKKRDALVGSARRAESARGIWAMLELAGSEEGIALAPGDFDAHPELLNVGNGVLDLTTGEPRDHDPALHLTKVSGAAYHPDAQAPEFARFLDRIQPDQAMRDYLARLLGHTLTGRVVEHVLAIFCGVGANGKTTLTEAVRATLGDYAAATDPGLLIDLGDVHPTGVADLFGLRLALTGETDAGRRLAEGTVKRLTGGETVKARRMREDFWEFTPTHSIVMSTNHTPIVTGTDEGIWRRLRLVPFPVVIPAEERDGKLPERLALELDGILAWLVRGHREWRDRGLADPEPVTAATAEFRADADMLGLFLEERCATSPSLREQSSDLFSEWVTWCKVENVEAGTNKAFSKALEERGFNKGRTSLGAVWRGIALQTGDEGDGAL